MSKNQFDKTKVIIVTIIVAGILIAIYMLMGDSRPEIDIPTSDGNIHIERR
jgi:hypothetical protein